MVPCAAAVALAGNTKQALGAVIVVEKLIVQVVVEAEPIVISPEALVPATVPFVVAPHAPLAIDVAPNVDIICPLKVVKPASVKVVSEFDHVIGAAAPPPESKT